MINQPTARATRLRKRSKTYEASLWLAHQHPEQLGLCCRECYVLLPNHRLDCSERRRLESAGPR